MAARKSVDQEVRDAKGVFRPDEKGGQFLVSGSLGVAELALPGAHGDIHDQKVRSILLGSDDAARFDQRDFCAGLG